jgi:hypothetical protein
MIRKIPGTILDTMQPKEATHARQRHKFAQRQAQPPEP